MATLGLDIRETGLADREPVTFMRPHADMDPNIAFCFRSTDGFGRVAECVFERGFFQNT